MPYLAFNLNDGNEFVFDILEERLSIGRHAKNDIVIDNTYISGSHAEFVRQSDGGYHLIDLKSSNGTFVNGKRIERAPVKGGDKIRFGQLDARFRERAPKGTAPASGGKPSSPAKNGPSLSDGRRGDTESIPARDSEPKRETSPISPGAPTLADSGPGTAPVALATPIAKQAGDATERDLQHQAKELKEEVRRLVLERDALRSENEKEVLRRDELIQLSKMLDEKRNEYTVSNAKLAEVCSQLSLAEAEAEKLALKKREAANLDSQLESARSQLDRVQADIKTATLAIQNLHKEAERARGNRGEAVKQVEELRAEVERLETIKRTLNVFSELHTPDHFLVDSVQDDFPLKTHLEKAIKAKPPELDHQIQKYSTNSLDLESKIELSVMEKQAQLIQIQDQLEALQSERESLVDAVTEMRRQHEELQAQENNLINKIEELAGTEAKIANATIALKAIESHKADLSGTISHMESQRDSLAREILAASEKGRAQHALVNMLVERQEVVEIQLRRTEEQQSVLSIEIGRGRETLHTIEGTLETKKQELVNAEARFKQLTHQSEESILQQTQIQQEMVQLRGDLTKARAELLKVRSETQAAVKDSEEATLACEQKRNQSSAIQAQVSDLETLLVSLLASQADRQANIAALEKERYHAEELLKARELEGLKAEQRLVELNRQTSDLELRLNDLLLAEKRLVEVNAACVNGTHELEAIKADLARLKNEREDHEGRLPQLRDDLTSIEAKLSAKMVEFASAEAKFKALKIQVNELELRESHLLQAEKHLEEIKREFEERKAESEALMISVQALGSQRLEHEKLLPGLRADVQVLKTELKTLMEDKQSLLAALERVQMDRKAAADQTESLRTESANLQKIIGEKRGTLEAEMKTKLAEANQAEAKLHELAAKLSAGEKRLGELATTQKQLTETKAALRENEARRLMEEKALAELLKQQERLRRELITLEDGVRAGTGQVNDLTKRIRTEETRAAETSARLEKAISLLQSTEAKRAEAELAATKAREEEKNLRKVIPALNTEVAGFQAVLAKLARERDEASQYVTRLNVSTDEGNKRVTLLQQQITNLEEAQRVREERVMKFQVEADQEAARVKAAQEKTRAVEATLQEAEREVKEIKFKTETARAQLGGLEADLKARLDRVEALKLEEARLEKEMADRKSSIATAEATLAELKDRILQEEKRVSEFTHIGGQILSFGAALAGLQARQSETVKSLRDSAERELALQVKINALQEASNRESTRAEEIRLERVRIESEFNTFNDIAQKQKASLQMIEAEQRKRLAEVDELLHEKHSLVERLGQDLSVLQDRRAEFAQAESQLKHWQGIESRLRGQLLELEEKHEIMRRGLVTDESTVVMFANDLIKRIDLIDALTSRYLAHDGGDVVAQLQTLRASFEDILLQHGISEFDVPVGTEVDTSIRKRIAVVDSIPGKDKPRIIETCRSGFIYSRDDGHEIILRKVEVKTSSQ